MLFSTYYKTISTKMAMVLVPTWEWVQQLLTQCRTDHSKLPLRLWSHACFFKKYNKVGKINNRGGCIIYRSFTWDMWTVSRDILIVFKGIVCQRILLRLIHKHITNSHPSRVSFFIYKIWPFRLKLLPRAWERFTKLILQSGLIGWNVFLEFIKIYNVMS